MANKKISELQSRTPNLTDLMLVGDPSSGYSYKCTVSALATIIETDIADGYVTIGTTQTISGAKTFSNNLALTSVSNANTDTDKFLVLNASNVVNFRTGAEVLSDIGGQGALTLTTTGTSGAATLIGNTLNIPQYQTALTNPVTGTGTTNYLAKFTGTSAIGNSIVFDNGTNVGISQTSPSYKLDVSGDFRTTTGAYFATSSGNIGIGTTVPTGSGGPILHIKAASIPEIHLTNSTTGDAYNDGFSLNVNGLNTYFTNYENGFLSFYTNNTERVRIAADGNVTFSQIANATTDTDRFLVSDSGVIKYRTGTELLSDIGGAASSSISGTTNYIPKFTSSSAIGNSVMQESSSNIGIGITPSAKLDVSASSGTLIRAEIAGVAQLNIGNNGSSINYYDANTQIFRLGNGSEQMRLTSTGLGIGTSSPAYKLDVSGSGTLARFKSTSGYSSITIDNTGTTGGSGFEAFQNGGSVAAFGVSGWIEGNTSSDGALYAGSSKGIRFYTNASEKMRLDASGNLGLGVTPSAWSGRKVFQLDVSSLSAASGNMFLGSNYYDNGTNNLYINNGYALLYAHQSGSHIWYNSANGTAGNAITFTQAMTLDASGRLGIGTTSPQVQLDVRGASQNTYAATIGTGLSIGNWSGLSFGYAEAGNNSYRKSALVFERTGSAAEGKIHILLNNASDVSSATLADSRMTILGSGNVGIGTTSPTPFLNANARTLAIDNSSNPAELALTGQNSNLYLANGGLASYIYSTGAYPLIFGTNGAEKMRITSGGNVGIGTTTPGSKLAVVGLPTTTSGLATGDFYRDGDGYVKVVL